MNTIARNILIRNIKMDVLYFLYSDEKYNEKIYFSEFQEKPNFTNPQTFSEKLLFLKMYYNNLLENACVDKLNVNDYINVDILR